MRFLADENVPRQIVEELRSAELDVASVVEVSPGASDDAVVEMAGEQSRLLITEDRDFGEMVVRRRLAVRGVILLELVRLSNAAAAARVAEVIAAHAGRLPGNLVVIEPGRVRIRPLQS
ncbi:MAG: DUF5615 family PIN-like protein [Reyranella sp.]|nr:DUF5615 family PIN-like protein [Reyranella sp.]